MYLSCVIAALIIILLIFIVRYNFTEHFDTYYNHDYGAQTVYERETGCTLPMKDTSLLAKYDWAEHDPLGLTVYDKYYEIYNFEEGAAQNADHEYAYRDIHSLGEDNVYDTKFMNTQLNPREDRISTFNWRDTCDRNPAKVYDWHSQEVDALSQKNY
jgi:hypothetical protein